MKYIPVEKKLHIKRKIFIKEGIRTSLPKPKMPLILFWNVHESKNIVLEQEFNFLDSNH